MYHQIVVLSVVLSVGLASPTNLGYAAGLGGPSPGYAAGNHVAVASGSAVSVAAAPVVAAAPAAVAPIATSSQARLDLITPNQVVTQVAAAPLRPVAIGGYGVAGSAAGVGYGGFVPGGLALGNAAAGYGGAAGHGLGGYGYHG